jgi:hypothetical protein
VCVTEESPLRQRENYKKDWKRSGGVGCGKHLVLNVLSKKGGNGGGAIRLSDEEDGFRAWRRASDDAGSADQSPLAATREPGCELSAMAATETSADERRAASPRHM